MCSIFGALIHSPRLSNVNDNLTHLWERSHERGRDGRGYVEFTSYTDTRFPIPSSYKSTSRKKDFVECEPGPYVSSLGPNIRSYSMIGNTRAEPTTEFVAEKKSSDQQPYSLGPWDIVHNGTIANDKQLRTNVLSTGVDSSAIVELLNKNGAMDELSFLECVRQLKGSYAILAVNSLDPNRIYVAANYRPIWFGKDEAGVYFASSRSYLPPGATPEMIEPYTVCSFFIEKGGITQTVPAQLRKGDPKDRALVVCSGGLDSVVSAAWAKSQGYDVHLIHFLYGSRAQGPEVQAVKAVADHLEVPLTLFPLNVYDKGDSPLLDPESAVAGGEAGAEFAHEWVPARNLLLLSVATAFAEARGIETIVLGNNLEEAGAYPDNEPEFISRYNDLLPFAVGDGKRMEVIMPVGNMMKHEIVALGKSIQAPMHLTWSCYRAGEHHCGTCGPCFMRRKAFEINNLEEVITYKDEK